MSGLKLVNSIIANCKIRSQTVKVTGLISTAAWGQGRSSPDRQFYYINGRPVDLPVVAKAVNEVYKSFNTHQLPLVVLDFSVPRGMCDPFNNPHSEKEIKVLIEYR